MIVGYVTKLFPLPPTSTCVPSLYTIHHIHTILSLHTPLYTLYTPLYTPYTIPTLTQQKFVRAIHSIHGDGDGGTRAVDGDSCRHHVVTTDTCELGSGPCAPDSTNSEVGVY
jgi:hypothetical protein